MRVQQAIKNRNMGVRRWRIVQQPTNFKRATGTFEIVYPTELLNIQRYRSTYPIAVRFCADYLFSICQRQVQRTLVR
jgi:hypothetical protein